MWLFLPVVERYSTIARRYSNLKFPTASRENRLRSGLSFSSVESHWSASRTVTQFSLPLHKTNDAAPAIIVVSQSRARASSSNHPPMHRIDSAVARPYSSVSGLSESHGPYADPGR